VPISSGWLEEGVSKRPQAQVGGMPATRGRSLKSGRGFCGACLKQLTLSVSAAGFWVISFVFISGMPTPVAAGGDMKSRKCWIRQEGLLNDLRSREC